MLPSLRHLPISSCYHQDHSVHPTGAHDHVLDVVGVSGTVDVGVVPCFSLVLHVLTVDRDAAHLFLRGVVDLRVIAEFSETVLSEHWKGGGVIGAPVPTVREGYQQRR